jgi:hypothetical protein
MSTHYLPAVCEQTRAVTKQQNSTRNGVTWQQLHYVQGVCERTRAAIKQQKKQKQQHGIAIVALPTSILQKNKSSLPRHRKRTSHEHSLQRKIKEHRNKEKENVPAVCERTSAVLRAKQVCGRNRSDETQAGAHRTHVIR